jgi:hypothetical protein
VWNLVSQFASYGYLSRFLNYAYSDKVAVRGKTGEIIYTIALLRSGTNLTIVGMTSHEIAHSKFKLDVRSQTLTSSEDGTFTNLKDTSIVQLGQYN